MPWLLLINFKDRKQSFLDYNVIIVEIPPNCIDRLQPLVLQQLLSKDAGSLNTIDMIFICHAAIGYYHGVGTSSLATTMVGTTSSLTTTMVGTTSSLATTMVGTTSSSATTMVVNVIYFINIWATKFVKTRDFQTETCSAVDPSTSYGIIMMFLMVINEKFKVVVTLW